MKVIATRSYCYSGRQIARGEEFDPTDADAKILLDVGAAQLTVNDEAGESAKLDVRPKRRRYRRRDQRAEDPR